jgi:hypothetical protein
MLAKGRAVLFVLTEGRRRWRRIGEGKTDVGCWTGWVGSGHRIEYLGGGGAGPLGGLRLIWSRGEVKHRRSSEAVGRLFEELEHLSAAKLSSNTSGSGRVPS